jgi:hypothetical protein
MWRPETFIVAANGKSLTKEAFGNLFRKACNQLTSRRPQDRRDQICGERCYRCAAQSDLRVD